MMGFGFLNRTWLTIVSCSISVDITANAWLPIVSLSRMPFDNYIWCLHCPSKFALFINKRLHISIPSHYCAVNKWYDIWTNLELISNRLEPGTIISMWHITLFCDPMAIKVDCTVKYVWWQMKCQSGWTPPKRQDPVPVFDAINEYGCCYHTDILLLLTECLGRYMYIVIAGVHFNPCAIPLPQLTNKWSAHSEPAGLIKDNLMKYASSPKFRSISFLSVEPLVHSLKACDYDYSPLFSMKSCSIWCPPPGRHTIMEMWS